MCIRDSFDALHLLAVVQSRLGKKDTALASYDRVLKVRPNSAEVLFNRGNILCELKRLEDVYKRQLNRFDTDWRWLLDREDSPWYPTARLFRQDETREWDNVIARVHAALGEFVRCRS